MSISLIVNGSAYTVDLEPETPLLWVLRDSLKLTGTKFGCGIAQCGACTALIDGQATRSCSVALSDVAGKTVTTIEGLSAEGTHPVQLAWIEFDVPQCGYCQSGQIMAAVALLKQKPKPTDVDINREMPISVAAAPIRASGRPFTARPSCRPEGRSDHDREG
jgi:aerobic-type carbon monoxide dehydrogenase small subunit (CoxS/CutS family)